MKDFIIILAILHICRKIKDSAITSSRIRGAHFYKSRVILYTTAGVLLLLGSAIVYYFNLISDGLRYIMIGVVLLMWILGGICLYKWLMSTDTIP